MEATVVYFVSQPRCPVTARRVALQRQKKERTSPFPVKRDTEVPSGAKLWQWNFATTLIPPLARGKRPRLQVRFGVLGRDVLGPRSLSSDPRQKQWLDERPGPRRCGPRSSAQERPWPIALSRQLRLGPESRRLAGTRTASRREDAALQAASPLTSQLLACTRHAGIPRLCKALPPFLPLAPWLCSAVAHSWASESEPCARRHLPRGWE